MKISVIDNYIISHFIHNLCISLIVMFGLLSCSQNEPIQDCSEFFLENIPTFYQEEFNAATCSLQDIDEKSLVQSVVIKNRADYEKYIICGGLAPNIDFEKYMVLAIRYRHHRCALLSDQKVQLCNANQIIYTVGISEQACLAPTSVVGFAVIEKKYADLKIQFNYNLK